MQVDSYFHRKDMVLNDTVYTFLVGYDTHAECHHQTFEGGFFALEVNCFAHCSVNKTGDWPVAASHKTRCHAELSDDFDATDLMEECVRDACIAAGFTEGQRQYINHWLLGEGSGVL